MHELSICKALIGEVTRVALEQNATSVSFVKMRIGPLSGVEISALQQAFEFARIGTMAEDAALEIEATPPKIRCRICAHEHEVYAHKLSCPACNSCQTDLIGGDECLLISIDLIFDDTTDSPHAEKQVEMDHV